VTDEAGTIVDFIDGCARSISTAHRTAAARSMLHRRSNERARLHREPGSFMNPSHRDAGRGRTMESVRQPVVGFKLAIH